MEEKQFGHLMVDIETMGNLSYSAIVSIGAVEFDIETGETGKEFYRVVDLQSCLDLGMKVNGDTILWWLRQSEEARMELMHPDKCKITTALWDFTFFCSTHYQVWGNSARFDMGLLHNAYEKAGISIPWNFAKERCVRTLVSFAPEIKKNYAHNGVDHNALSDCHKQIGYCSMTWKHIKRPSDKIGHSHF
jgi:hypothetical protein